MLPTIRQTWEESKVCQQFDLGLRQEVLPPAMIEELLETYQMWEERERKLNMVLLVECGTHLICDAELSACRQGEASSLRLLLERWPMEQSLLVWESGFQSRGRRTGLSLGDHLAGSVPVSSQGAGSALS